MRASPKTSNHGANSRTKQCWELYLSDLNAPEDMAHISCINPVQHKSSITNEVTRSVKKSNTFPRLSEINFVIFFEKIPKRSLKALMLSVPFYFEYLGFWYRFPNDILVLVFVCFRRSVLTNLSGISWARIVTISLRRHDRNFKWPFAHAHSIWNYAVKSQVFGFTHHCCTNLDLKPISGEQHRKTIRCTSIIAQVQKNFIVIHCFSQKNY